MKRIAVLSRGLCKWNGGVDFLRLILRSLLASREEEDERMYLFVPNPTNRFISKIVWRLSGGKRRLHTMTEQQEWLSDLTDGLPNISIIRYSPFAKGLLRTMKKENIDVVGPTYDSLGPDFPTPWIGYVYDFQHHYLRENYSTRERRKHEKRFAGIAHDAPAIICNAEDVRNDMKRFFPEATNKLIVLPFTPSPMEHWFHASIEHTRTRYGIPKSYFIICNQFWKHKDHATAFRAMRKFLDADRRNEQFKLVCTGRLEETREPAYIGKLMKLIKDLGLTDSVICVGHIPKNDQIALLRGATALVQPTLLEGGPGGGATYDAIAVGTPALLSDLPVNKEIQSNAVWFFRTGNAEDLSSAMHSIAWHPPKRKPPTELIAEGKERLHRLGKVWREAIRAAERAHNQRKRRT